MAGRIRTIKPETLDDEVAAALSDAAWRLWISTWMLADDHGNARASGRYLAAMVWQDTGRLPRITEALGELRRAGLVTLYENNGQAYLHINGWEKHQRMDNAGKPRVPRPDESNQVVTDRFAENVGEPPKVTEVCGSTSDHDQRPTTTTNEPPASPAREVFDFETGYALYPRKEGRKKGLQRFKSQITTRLKYDAWLRAIRNYAAKILADGTEPRFVKQFDTFMSCWEDFVEYQAKPAASGERTYRNFAAPRAPIAEDAPPEDF